MSESLKKLGAMSLFVEDVQQAKSFYQEVFGVSVIFEDEVSAAMQFDNLIVNLLQVSEAVDLLGPSPVATREAGSRCQFSIFVGDADAVCAELTRRGVTLLSGPVDKPWGMRVATFADPAGHNWEVAQNL